MSNFPPPFWQPWRAPSTASLAQGSGCSWAGVSPWGAQGRPLPSGGAISTVTGVQAPGGHRGIACQRFLSHSWGRERSCPRTVSRGCLASKCHRAWGIALRGGAPVPWPLGRGWGQTRLPGPWAGRAGAAGSAVLRELPMPDGCGEGALRRDSTSRSSPGGQTGLRRGTQDSGDHSHLDMGTAHSQDIQMPTSGPGSTCAQPQGSRGVSRRSGSLAGVGCLQVLASSPCSSCCCYQAWALERGTWGLSLPPPCVSLLEHILYRGSLHHPFNSRSLREGSVAFIAFVDMRAKRSSQSANICLASKRDPVP